MIKSHSYSEEIKQSGFSAVELLITLFVAVMFLIAGYQLYSFAFSRSVAAGQDARASDLAYDLLQAYKRGEVVDEADTATCAEHMVGEKNENDVYTGIVLTDPSQVNPAIGNRDLSVSLASIKIDCPYDQAGLEGLDQLRRITAAITYKAGTTEKTVSYASYDS